MSRPWHRIAFLTAAVPVALRAQSTELRVDAIGSPVVWHAGAGITWPMGAYARVSGVGSYGVSAAATSERWRADILARVVLDPFRRHRVGFSFGGGLTWLDRPYLLAVLEVEGPTYRGVTLALQGALGGGPRIGLVVRPALEGRR